MPQILEDIARPISDSAPSGEDIARLTASPENEAWIRTYGELRGLINKVASNCDSIVALSQSILAEKSKDLRIAGHLCRGLLHQSGFVGLAEGLNGYRLLLEEYWDKDLYPSRDAARATNVKTLDKLLGNDISARTRDNDYFVPASPEDVDAMGEIKDAAEAIGAILTEKVPARATPMDEVIRTIGARLRELGPAKKPTPPPEASEPEPKGGVRGLLRRKAPPPEETVEEEQAPAESEEEAIGKIQSEIEAVKAAIQAADFLLKKDPKNPASYRLLRSSLWYSLPLFNPEPRAGKRITQYLPPVGKSELEQLMRDEDWEVLVIQCETAFVQRFASGCGGCFCLDIQRFLSTALKELIKKAEEESDKRSKDAYETVNNVVLREAAILVERYPWITDLLYSDETPFADGQTKNWVEKTVKPALGAASDAQQGAAGGSMDSDPQVHKDFEEAQDLLAKQKWNEALDLMQKGIDADPTRRGSFQRRLNLANLCLDAGQPAMARPLLEQLDEEIERFSLDQWEPGLCVQVWNCLRRSYQELTPEGEQQESEGRYRDRADKLFEKICRLDIRAALAGSA